MQKTDGEAGDARLDQNLHLSQHGFDIEWYLHLPILRQTLTRLSAKWARH